MNINRIKDALPWAHIADHLKPSAERKSGVEGALYGAVYGAVAAMASLSDRNNEPIKPLIAGTAIGIIFGATDAETINRLGGGKAKH